MSNQNIAIIGMSGKYPDADSLDDLWENLKQGKDAIREVPEDRWNHALYYQAGERIYGKSYSKWGGFINGVDHFDPLFFSIAPGVAELLDPQERQFLECAFHTVEDAGYSYEALSERGPVGVFAAVEYSEYIMYSQANSPVSALNASISNRVSYCCNFTGPSITIDTMCSGSISTIHLACQSIAYGECSAAIAGGVNLTLHPNKFILHSAGRYSSTTGRCRSFGEGATGYVASEGVGAVLLKPLDYAIEDGDHIYGVIQATAINHGGTSRTYTVPKASSQSAVIRNALKKADTDPISYIEAHGSGTAIGDVIEIDGLQKAYSDDYLSKNGDGKSSCFVGSIKSNIGHCESASGIAGLTKVLLQLRYKTIVPSIHAQTTNSYIDFENSPFRIPQETLPWTVADGGKRVAGISAFGAGGSNAHMIVEEYVDASYSESVSGHLNKEEYVLLSARNPDQLLVSARLLLDAIKVTGESLYGCTELNRISYTLQVGRKHHEHRLAICVESISDLAQKLERILENGFRDISSQDQIWSGVVIRGKALKEYIESNHEACSALMANHDWHGLLLLWLCGYPVSWSELYTGRRPGRVSLPGYPFARQRCWIPNADVTQSYPPLEVLNNSTDENGHIERSISISGNPSYLRALTFSVELQGDEYFITQHVVNGLKVMPGVAYLELAREALSQLLPRESCFALKNIVWRRPMVFETSSREVLVEFEKHPEVDKSVPFRIFDKLDQEKGDFCRGYAQLQCATDAPLIKDFENLISDSAPNELTKKELYRQFANVGLNYGAELRAADCVRRCGNKVIGQVRSQVPDDLDSRSMKWKPEVLDSALHCILGCFIDNEKNNGKEKVSADPMVPFALASIRQFLPLPETVWVVIDVPENTKHVQSVDLSLCDESGRVCLKMAGYASRKLKGSKDRVSNSSGVQVDRALERSMPMDQQKATKSNSKVLLLSQASEPVKSTGRLEYATSREGCHWLLLIDKASCWKTELRECFNNTRVISLSIQSKSLDVDDSCSADAYQHYAIGLLDVLKEALAEKENKPISVQMVLKLESSQHIFAGLFGALRVACSEHIIKFANLIETDSLKSLKNQFYLNCNAGKIGRTRSTSEQVVETRWKRMKESDQPAMPWKEDGVYLVTGGFGGLGRFFIEEILANTRSGIAIIWGRGEISDTRKELLDKWNSHGVRAFYQPVDVTDFPRVDRSIIEMVEKHGHLNGILHGAGVLNDGMIAKKTPEQLKMVFSPKVQGLVNIHKATKACDLDFLILFSSVSGALGSAGQIDYSAANGFMDCFALDRNRLVSAGLCSGRTLSVNWPLWEDGGMKMPRHAMRELKERSGMTPMPRDEGVEAFYRAISSDATQVLVLCGDGREFEVFSKSLQALSYTHDENSQPVDYANQNINEHDVIRAASDLLKLPESSILGSTGFFDMGFDSVSVSELARVLGEKLKIELSPAVFYECTTVSELVEYLSSKEVELDVLVGYKEGEASANTDYRYREDASYISDVSIIKAISTLLKVPEASVDAKSEFFDIGFDSVSISELATSISEIYGMDLSPTIFYELTTIGELVEYLKFQSVGMQSPGEPSQECDSTHLVAVDVSENSKEKVHDDLIAIVGEILKISRTDVDVDVELAQLGFDSVSFAELAQIIERKYAIEISPAIFYEYETVLQIADYLSDYSTGSVGGFTGNIEIGNRPSADTHFEKSKTTLEVNKLVNVAVISTGESDHSRDMRSESIAVIGMHGRFPGADSLDEFWENLVDGKDSVTEVPTSRWDWKKIYGDTNINPRLTRSKWGGFIDNIDHFDAELFSISPFEARQMDPQQRILLQSAWHAIEDAGYAPSSLSGSNTGVYIGIAHTSGYSSVKKECGVNDDASTQYSGPINAPSLGPNRISYFLNLNGPSEPIETACSSSLVAIHRAVSALRSGECNLCIAGGVNIMVTEQGHVSLSRAGLLSDKGKCKTFSKNADGYVRSEGVGTVLLKRLSDAERDGDNILAVIRNSKVGYTGKGSAFAAPNTNSQASLIKSCYDEQQISASRVSYIEVQGTGTELGDAVEFQALTKAFKHSPPERCAIASVKTNIGHLEVASGMASLIKVIMQMSKNRIAANLHCDAISPHIKLDDSPFYVPISSEEWTEKDANEPYLSKIAGINAFGFGGVNAHLVVEEHIDLTANSGSKAAQPCAIVMSAKSVKQVEIISRNLLDALRNRPQLDLYNVAYTLQVGRSAMNERVGLVVDSLEDCIEKLSKVASGDYSAKDIYRGSVSRNNQVISSLEKDLSMRSVILGWMKERNIGILTSLWTNGLSIEWSDMYRGETVKRVSLPGYPFEPVRHWVGESEDSTRFIEKNALDKQQSDDADLGEKMLKLFQDIVTGAGRLSATDDLAEVSISSLEILMLSQRIRESLHVDAPVELLASCSSIKELAMKIHSVSVFPEPQSGTKLVKLSRNGTSGPALICVPAAGAMLTSLYPLAKHLDRFVKVYGIGHRGISGSETPHETIHEMAQEYVHLLSAEDEMETVYLLGHSLGASVVYEMGCQLRNQGRNVHIFLLDSQLYAESGMSLSSYFHSFVGDVTVAQEIAQRRARGENVLEKLTASLVDEVESRYGASADVKGDGLQKIVELYAYQILMGLDYVPSQKYDGDITLLLAEDGDVGGDNLGRTIEKYNLYCIDTPRTVSIGGDHYSVLSKPNVADLADVLIEFIVPSGIDRGMKGLTSEIQ